MSNAFLNLKTPLLPLAILHLIALTSGCASITSTALQSISVQTVERDGKDVPDATCEFTNSKGSWLVTSPGSVKVTSSNDDMQVLCNKQGIEPGKASVVSRVKGQMFGNIFIGGGIGAIVDHGTGAGYEYPSFIQVQMAAFKKIELPYPYIEQSAAIQPTAPRPETPQSVASQPEPYIFLSPRIYVIPNPLYR